MLKIIRRLRGQEIVFMAVSLAFIVAQVWLELKIPDYMKEVLGYVTGGSPIGKVWRTGGLMLACAAGSLAASVAVGFCAARISASFSARLRGDIFRKVQSFSMAEINRFSTDSLITRSTNDVTQVQMLVVMGLETVFRAPIMAVWALVKISDKSWQWSAATAVAVVLLVSLIAAIFFVALPRFKRIQRYTDDLNRVTRENLTGVRVVRAYNAEEYQEEKFEKVNDVLTRTHIFTMRTMSVMNPGMSLIMNGLNLAIYWIGAALIAAAGTAALAAELFSDMIVFSSYAMQIVMAFMMLTMIGVMLPRAAVSAKRINEVLDAVPSIVDGPGAEGAAAGEVEFRDVSFRYPDAEEPILEHISFRAGRGETVAFIGSTGSGKSTVVNLVPRFYDATEGEVLVAGVNVRDYKLHELREKIGYVSQRATLFSGTVASNVAFGSDAPDEAGVERAVGVAQGAEFVEKMEGKYSAEIAQGGTNVSGGQKQRLSVARAVYKHPEIYIFDDSFSALDYKTDRDLRAALRREAGDATCLIVAQRIGTIRDADRIVVLDEGKMAGYGTHDELMKNCKVYREIAYSQLSKEELGEGEKEEAK